MAVRTSLPGIGLVVDNAMKVVEARMEKATVIVQGHVRKLINRGNSTGKSPSAPGEPPKKVTANLYRNINRAVVRKGNEIFGYVGTPVKYGRRLELGFVGTDKKGRKINQKPRPFLRPALANAQQQLKKVFGE